jgi:hypothetical protein
MNLTCWYSWVLFDGNAQKPFGFVVTSSVISRLTNNQPQTSGCCKLNNKPIYDVSNYSNWRITENRCASIHQKMGKFVYLLFPLLDAILSELSICEQNHTLAVVNFSGVPLKPDDCQMSASVHSFDSSNHIQAWTILIHSISHSLTDWLFTHNTLSVRGMVVTVNSTQNPILHALATNTWLTVCHERLAAII